MLTKHIRLHIHGMLRSTHVFQIRAINLMMFSMQRVKMVEKQTHSNSSLMENRLQLAYAKRAALANVRFGNGCSSEDAHHLKHLLCRHRGYVFQKKLKRMTNSSSSTFYILCNTV